MQIPRYSLTFWLRLSYAAVVMVTAAALALLINRHLETVLEAQVHARMKSDARVLANGFDVALGERLASVRLLALLPALRSGQPNHRAVYPFFERMVEHEPQYAWIGFADATGRVLVASDGLLEGMNVAERPWFVAASKRPYIGEPHAAVLLAKLRPPAADGQPLRFIDVAAPVFDEDGRFVGVVGSHLSVRWAQLLQQQFVGWTGNTGSAEVLVTDSSGVVLIGPPGLQGKHASNLPGDERFLVEQAHTASLESGRGLGWTVQIRMPREVALRSVARLRSTIAWGTALLAVIAIFVAAALARGITAPLVRLADAASRMQFDRTLTLPATAGYAEAHQLYVSLDRLLADLKAREAALVTMASDLETRVAERTHDLERANAELGRLSFTDALTGVSNRRKFEQMFADELARATEQGQGLGLLLVDIDHFKHVNDTYGHPVGDRVLVEVAAVLQAGIRPADLLARVGGEEFAIIAPPLEQAQAGIVAERVRAAVEACSPLRVGRAEIAVTVSVGVVVIYPDNATDHGEVLATRLYTMADAALYRAKQGGRNRFEIAPAMQV